MRYRTTIREIGGEDCIHYGTSPTWMLNKLMRDISLTNIRHVEFFSFEVLPRKEEGPGKIDSDGKIRFGHL